MADVLLTKHCRRCDEDKPVTEFYVSRTRNSQLSTYCRDCTKQIQKDRHRQFYRPGDHRRATLKKRYGITPEDYDRMLDEQGGACLCGRGPEGHAGGVLFIDHDHETGKVRGLLCGGCNILVALIEKARQDPELIRKLTAYLERANG